MLISDSKKRLQINSDKRKKILMFLLENRYSNLRNFFIPQLQQRAQIIKYVSSIAPAPIHREIVSVVFNALRER